MDQNDAVKLIAKAFEEVLIKNAVRELGSDCCFIDMAAANESIAEFVKANTVKFEDSSTHRYLGPLPHARGQ